MFDTNEYFDGKVKSISFTKDGKKATVGVMAAGEYEFSTSCNEDMHVLNGSMLVILPGKSEWEEFKTCESFKVPANASFKVKLAADTAYVCEYS